MLGNIEDKRRRGWQRMRWLDSITNTQMHEFEQTFGDSEGQGGLGLQRVGHNLATEQQQQHPV